MRSSRPIPRATSTTSAPVSSQTLAISLMNEILVARNALAASLTISALAMSVRTSGAPSGSYSSTTASSAQSPSSADHDAVGMQEVLDGRALLQELGAGHVAEARPCRARRRSAGSSAPVPHGTVDFITSAWPSERGHRVDHGCARPIGRRRPSRWAVCRPPRTAVAQCSSAGARSVEKCKRSRLRGHQLLETGLVDRDLAALADARSSPRRCPRTTRRCPTRRSRQP